MKLIIDCTNDEFTTRELNKDELVQADIDAAMVENAKAAEQAKAEANAAGKAALLARLGITADEAKLLLG